MDTIKAEKKSLKETDQKIRDNAYEASKPTAQQGAKVAVGAAVLEGGGAFVSVIIRKRGAGKRIADFSQEDWQEILKETGVGAVKGGTRGVSIYVLTNFTATPAAVASSLCTASFGLAEQAHLLRSGRITEDEFVMNSEAICLDTAVSALSSFVGQAVIPIPVFGAVIGNTIGTLMYQIAKDNLSKKEQKLIASYLRYLDNLEIELDKKYHSFINEMDKGLYAYYSILERAFSPNYEEALCGSVELALSLGVPSEELLKSIPEVDDYFLN